MSALVRTPSVDDLLRAVDALKTMDNAAYYDAAVSLGQAFVATSDAGKAGLGEIALEIDTRYGTGAIERYARDTGGVKSSSLYDYRKLVKVAGGKENVIALVAQGYNYDRQRTAMRHCDDTETFLAKLTGQALPDPSAPKRPRKVIDMQQATVCEIRGGFAIIDLGALAVDLVAGKKYRTVFYEIEGE